MKLELTIRNVIRTVGALCALLVLWAVLALCGVGTAALPLGQSGQRVIAQNGFGNHQNSYAWSMGWFKGKLYVGTGRDVLCVENETVQFFVPLSAKYTTRPFPGMSCPPDPYHMDLRAQIWQFTPQTGRWRQVYESPKGPRNPFARNKHVARDIAYRHMLVYTDRSGRQAMFAAGVSADEYLPPLLKSHPPRVLRTYDGVHWEDLNLPSVVVHYPRGSTRAMGFRELVEWRHRLYVTATPDLTGDGALFEITRPWSRHPGLRQVSPRNLDIFEVATFHGDLYLGCGDPAEGYSVWEWSGHGRPFIPIVTGGAGRGAVITSVVSMHVFRNALYVGASGWYHESTLPLSEMIRIAPDGRWSLVVGSPRRLPDGSTAYPTSGLTDGFDSLFNAHFWRMAVDRGGLYVGTNSWSYIVKTYKGKAWLGDLLADAAGYQLWATCNGDDWFSITRDAFGANEYNFGARTLQPGAGGSLYIGSANHAQGTMIVEDREPACSSLLNPSRGVAPPSEMIADHVRKGTLLSWKRSASAARYEVLAAPEVSLTLYLKAPPIGPSGFPFEGATPTVTGPETPGSVPVTLSLTGSFEPVATTSGTFFVDRAPRHRVFEVVARDAFGRASSPSNIQIAPVPEPPATFAGTEAALAASTRATIASAGSVSWPRRLLSAAQAAWRRGDRNAALADVRRLRATAGGDEQLAALTLRLERRLQYAQAAGEP